MTVYLQISLLTTSVYSVGTAYFLISYPVHQCSTVLCGQQLLAEFHVHMTQVTLWGFFLVCWPTSIFTDILNSPNRSDANYTAHNPAGHPRLHAFTRLLKQELKSECLDSESFIAFYTEVIWVDCTEILMLILQTKYCNNVCFRPRLSCLSWHLPNPWIKPIHSALKKL